MSEEINKLKLIRLGIDTKYEFIIYMHADCFICKSEGFEASTRVLVSTHDQSIIATLDIIHSDIIKPNEASLSESAWARLDVQEGQEITLSHISPVTTFKYVRSKIYGNELHEREFDEVIQDIVAGRYSNIHISSFITACANDNINQIEMVCLTKAMVRAGEQLKWDHPYIMDKHSVGGIPGNRTTPIVVPIIAEAGLIIPKTSSRAITSPSGTADTIETMTNVDLNIVKMREVVNKEGGCFVWGGGIGLSPADDIIIRVERTLDLDPTGQMIASVLSKKAAVGTTHVIIDVPVGPTAKIRSENEFLKLKDNFEIVGKALGIFVVVLKTDGHQPLGKGIGPALEARDILDVLNNNEQAVPELKEKAIILAGVLLELGNKSPPGQGYSLAKKILESGSAFKKFIAICEAQGCFKEPSSSIYQYDITAPHQGMIIEIDNRNLAMIAKLAGTPHDTAAGIEFFSRLGTKVNKGDLLYRIHAESKGALYYALQFARTTPNIIKIIQDE